MIYLMMANQSYREIPAAVSARVVEGKVVCSDDLGRTVACFDAPTVSAFGIHTALRDPALGEPSDVGVRRDREMAEMPLASARPLALRSF